MIKTRNLLIAGVFLVALPLSVGSLSAAGEVIQRDFSFAPGSLLQIDVDRGSVELHTGGGSGIHVRVETSRGQVSDYVDLRFEEGDGLRIIGEKVRGGLDRGNITFTIDAPTQLNLDLRTGGGHLDLDEIDGDARISTGGGHIQFADISGELQIDTGGGHVQGGRVGQMGRIETGGGHIGIEEVGGDLEVRTGGGHVEVGDVDGNLAIRTGGGHLSTGYVQGEAELRSGGGHVSMKGCARDAKIDSGGGELHLDSMEGYVVAHTGGGDVFVTLAPGNTAGADIVSKDDGDITVSVASGAGFDVDAVASGRVEVDGSLRASGNDGRRMSGRIGGGGNVIRVRADDGDIRFVSGG